MGCYKTPLLWCRFPHNSPFRDRELRAEELFHATSHSHHQKLHWSISAVQTEEQKLVRKKTNVKSKNLHLFPIMIYQRITVYNCSDSLWADWWVHRPRCCAVRPVWSFAYPHHCRQGCLLQLSLLLPPRGAVVMEVVVAGWKEHW